MAPQHAGIGAEPAANIPIDRLQDGRRLDVAVQQFQHLRPDTAEQTALLHDAAASTMRCGDRVQIH